LPSDFRQTAQLQQAFDHDQATALALASADFDEDGVPDLISGYSATRRGLVTLHRGNVDSIFPNSADAARRRMTSEFTDFAFLRFFARSRIAGAGKLSRRGRLRR
jgi:hypothetical protein